MFFLKIFSLNENPGSGKVSSYALRKFVLGSDMGHVLQIYVNIIHLVEDYYFIVETGNSD